MGSPKVLSQTDWAELAMGSKRGGLYFVQLAPSKSWHSHLPWKPGRAPAKTRNMEAVQDTILSKAGFGLTVYRGHIPSSTAQPSHPKIFFYLLFSGSGQWLWH